MRRSIRIQVAISVLLTVILEAGCGGGSLLTTFRIALASSSPLVNSLVAAGAIDSTKSTAIIQDFNDGAQCGLTLQNDFNAISKDLPASEQKAQKFQASSRGLSCFRVIIQRQNFASNPRVQQIANIAEGILASLVMFYSGPSARASQPHREAVSASTEKELEQKLKVKVDRLEELMKP